MTVVLRNKRPQDAQPYNLLCVQKGLGVLSQQAKGSSRGSKGLPAMRPWGPHCPACYNEL